MIRSLAFCLLFAGPVWGQTPLDDQEAAALSRLEEAHMMLQAAQTAADPVTTLTAAVRAYEDALIPLQANAARATAAYDAAQAAFDPKDPAVSKLLVSLMSMNATPEAGLHLHPGGAVPSLRGALIRDDVEAALDAQATLLGQGIAALGVARDAKTFADARFLETRAGIADARAALERALRDRPPLPQRFVADPIETAVLSATATNFADLTQALRNTYGQGLPNDAMLAAKGQLAQPVTGRVLQAFGTENDTAPDRQGITFATPAQALIVSPMSATILYQGPAGSFETVVAIEPSAGITIIFAGLSTIYGTPGEIVPAGAPLGMMGGESALADMNLTTFPASGSGGASQALYLEVREGQTPVDPATWFALEQQVDEQ